MATSDSPLRLIRHPLALRRVQVVRRTSLSPKMVRLTFSSSELEGFVSLAPEDHVKVFFPDPVDHELVLPTFGPNGPMLPSNGRKPIARDYTPRRFDRSTHELDIDFYLHGNGVAARWAADARVGDTVAVAGPRGSYLLERDFALQVFVGDETALPEFARRIEEMDDRQRAIAVALVDGAAEEHPIPTSASLEMTWVHRLGAESAEAAARVVDALRSKQFPDSTYFWLAGEAREIKTVMRYLASDRGVPRARLRASGHWKRGIENHDHHTPIESDG